MNYKLTWREAAEVPFGMTAPQHVVIGCALYVGGGQTDRSDSNRVVLHYCMNSNQWHHLPPSPFMHFGLGQFGGKLITIGGSLKDHNTTVIGNVMQFCKDTSSWVEITKPMPTPRRRVCVVSHQSHFAACGGIGCDGECSNAVEVFYQEQWHSCSLPAPRAALSATIKDNTVYFTGGYYPKLKGWNHAKEDCQSIDLPMLLSCENVDSSWSSLPPLPAKCTTVTSHHDTLMVMGGLAFDPQNSKATYLDGVYAYSSGTDSWVLVDKLPFQRSSMMVASTYQGNIIIVGGWEEMTAGSNESTRSKSVMIGTYTLA